MAQPGPKWLLQFTPTPHGIARHCGWGGSPYCVLIYDKADRDRRVREAEEALLCGDIYAFRCDPV
jgi:hypothetical protein